MSGERYSSCAACGVMRGSYMSKHPPPSIHATHLPNTTLHSSLCNLVIDHLHVRGKEFEESCCHDWGQFTYIIYPNVHVVLTTKQLHCMTGILQPNSVTCMTNMMCGHTHTVEKKIEFPDK